MVGSEEQEEQAGVGVLSVKGVVSFSCFEHEATLFSLEDMESNNQMAGSESDGTQGSTNEMRALGDGSDPIWRGL